MSDGSEQPRAWFSLEVLAKMLEFGRTVGAKTYEQSTVLRTHSYSMLFFN